MLGDTRHVLRPLRLALIGLSWVVVAALVAISGFHLVHSEPWTVVLDLIAVTPWIYMLAWLTTVRRPMVPSSSAVGDLRRARFAPTVVGGTGFPTHLTPGSAHARGGQIVFSTPTSASPTAT